MAGLRVSRLDVLDGTLSVEEIVTRDSHGSTVPGPPKSAAGNRILSLPSVLVDLLADHLTQSALSTVDGDAFVSQLQVACRGPVATTSGGSGYLLCTGPNYRASASMTCAGWRPRPSCLNNVSMWKRLSAYSVDRW